MFKKLLVLSFVICFIGNIQANEIDQLIVSAFEGCIIWGNYQGARQYLTNAINLGPTQAQQASIDHHLAGMLHAEKNYEEARALYLAVINNNDAKLEDLGWSRIMLGDIYYLHDKNYEMAKSLYMAFINMNVTQANFRNVNDTRNQVLAKINQIDRILAAEAPEIA